MSWALSETIRENVKQLSERDSQPLVRPRIYEIPRLHKALIDNEENQYIIIKGGRGGFKTTSFICSMIEYSYQYKDCAFLFTREIAKSIEDSVYSVVVDLIIQASIESDFDIGKRQITNRKSGVKFIFSGLRSTGGKTAMSQINKVKGLHKIRMIFFEEGQDLSEDSLNVILPTANRKGRVRLINQAQEEEDLQQARFFVAMNPNKPVDPVISKFRPYQNEGKAVIEHINMMDVVEEEPDFADDELINHMELERGEWFFDHVWEGAPFHLFSGLPFSEHSVEECEINNVLYAFLDPSFKGGDYTALCFLADTKAGKPCAWGYAFKSAWNMEPALSGCINAIRQYQPNRFFYEDNSLGTVPEREFALHGIKALFHISIINKEERIYKVAAFTKNIVVLAKNHGNSTWLQQVLDYSNEAEHDDAPDSFANAVIKSGVIKDRLKF